MDSYGKVAVITGGAGLLGMKHAEAILEAGGCPILWDIKGSQLIRAAKSLSSIFKKKCDKINFDLIQIRNDRDYVDPLFNYFKGREKRI